MPLSRCLVGLVLALVTLSVVESADPCGFKTPTGQYFNLNPLTKDAMSAYRVFDNDNIFSFNLCAGAQCGVASDAPACKQPATPSNPPDLNEFEGIGSMTPVAQSLTQMDIADINWKTQHMPPFPTDATGVKLVYPAFGHMPPPPPGAQQAGYPGAQSASGAYGQMPGQQPGQQQNGYAQPQGWGQQQQTQQQADPWGQQTQQAQQPADPWAPAPTPPANSWGQPAQQSNPYAQNAAGAPGGQPLSPGKHSTLGMTIMALCDKTLKQPVAMQFARGQTYKDRSSGYLFVIAAAHACPTSPPGDVLGTGLNWGWFFITMLSITMALYCGIGMVWKYKKLGVTGIETVPNIEFWRDLPGLIKDGIAYFLKLVKQCLAKGGGPASTAGGGYSTV